MKTLIIGPGASALAVSKACALLGVKPEDMSPDLLMVEPQEGKYGVEAAGKIVAYSELAPVGERRCVVIQHINEMTEQGQNRLLKTLEESSCDFIVTATSQTGVLKTISSRLVLSKLMPLPYAEFCNKVNAERTEEMSLLYAITSGVAENVQTMKPRLEFYKELSEKVALSDFRGVMSLLGLVKEKDPRSFLSVHKEEVPLLFSFIQSVLIDCEKLLVGERSNLLVHTTKMSFPEIEARLAVVGSQKRLALKRSYDVNQFFEAFASMV